MTILVFVPHYLPGYKSGGPVRSIANLVAHLGRELRFVIATADRDAGDAAPYPGIFPGERHRVGEADVIYLGRSQTRPGRVLGLVRRTQPDVIYLNSFFSRPFSINVILLRRLGLIRSIPIVLAPRGEFSPGALQIKRRRKRTLLAASRALRLHRDVIWQASSALEAADIRRAMGAVERDGTSRIIEAPVIADSGRPAPGTPPVRHRTKVPYCLRVAFLSRVAPKKNLLGALHILQHVRGSVELSIFGPIEDEGYWRRCREAMDRLPANVRAAYRGPVAPTDVPAVLAENDLFFLPTHGENYGHVIREALDAGTPVLVSDQTPWRNLALAGIGWDLPLDRPHAFREALEMCIAMDAPTFADWSARAARYAREHAADANAVEASRRLFLTATMVMPATAVGHKGTISAR